MTSITTKNNDKTIIASCLYSALIDVAEQLHSVSERAFLDFTIRGHFSWQALLAIPNNPYVSSNTREKVLEYIEVVKQTSVSAIATPSFHQDIIRIIEEDVRNYQIFNADQVDEAMKIILDTEYQPQIPKMILFRRDLTLADEFLRHTRRTPWAYSFEERGGLTPL